MKLLIINGPNINLIGIREPEIYGSRSYEELCTYINKYANSKNIDVIIYQSNHEGEIIDKIQNAIGVYDGIIINPAAYTHTSIAIADAIASVNIPCIEVHLTDPDKRESFRRVSFIRNICIATFSGEGFNSYIKAIDYLLKI